MTATVAGAPLAEDPRDWTPDQIEAMLPGAVKAVDTKAIEALIGLLALKDPDRAQLALDTLEVGVLLARRAAGSVGVPQNKEDQKGGVDHG